VPPDRLRSAICLLHAHLGPYGDRDVHWIEIHVTDELVRTWTSGAVLGKMVQGDQCVGLASTQ